MKKLFCILTCSSLFFAACNNNHATKNNPAGLQPGDTVTTAKSGQGAALAFEETVHNFGDITQGEKVEYSFKFTNTGTTPLVIEDAVASCGCTVPEWPKSPIKPGESGFMKVIFDSNGKSGYTEKEISIKTNGADGYVVGPKIQCNIITK
ncbi:DUF1573 domain-containing protein [Chitinophaga nivalis]|uniref:DUF1573 domain-containing protein n=1 Tax=Chitinophaga nivalis TaxID=2991709 RepID=A0ABT3IPW7_9BACT|nr:DUF1573 domain-containing protein [Chitinophaga nivalis]MCW3464295.1 DUF1573 domain-containing protein [Chitinophaga nivalis]MCW3486014.1 DUF1573 domain-containing protein [Chitinophaga nivalis]